MSGSEQSFQIERQEALVSCVKWRSLKRPGEGSFGDCLNPLRRLLIINFLLVGHLANGYRVSAKSNTLCRSVFEVGQWKRMN